MVQLFESYACTSLLICNKKNLSFSHVTDSTNMTEIKHLC